MITGRQAYVVVDFADDMSITAVYGPFPTTEEAQAWSGMPGGSHGAYCVQTLYSPPQWFEGYLTGEDEDEVHDSE